MARVMRRSPVAAAATGIAAVLSGCASSPDPAQGGFASGVSGVAGGGYERRIETREAEVEARRDRQAALESEAAEVEAETGRLEAEIAASESDLADLKRELIALRYRIEAAGVAPDPELEARVEAAVASRPGGSTPEDRLESLSRAVSDARSLVETLARLAG